MWPRISVLALAVVTFSSLPAVARPGGDSQLDQMMQQMRDRHQKPMSGTASCAGVEIRYQTVPNDGPGGPGIDFQILNNTDHTVAVWFGFRLISNHGQQFTEGLVPGPFGAGRINPHRSTASRHIGIESDIFPNPIDPSQSPNEIEIVKITPIWIAPNLDVEPPDVEAGAYVNVWRDYRDIVRCTA